MKATDICDLSKMLITEIDENGKEKKISLKALSEEQKNAVYNKIVDIINKDYEI